MDNIEGLKLINRIQKDVMDNGLDAEKTVADLKDLRENYALEYGNPRLTKVIRLTYEHIEENGSFNIPMPEDEPVEELEGTDEVAETPRKRVINIDDDPAAQKESFLYLMELMVASRNKMNHEELGEYRDNLLTY